MAEHFQMAMQLQNANPGLLAWLGEGPLPTPMGPSTGTPSGQPINGDQPNLSKMQNPQAPMQQRAGEVRPANLPNMPPNADQNTRESYDELTNLMQ
jgi:hypothetical protein